MVKDKRITDARRRIDVANQNVTEPMKLCNRTKSALDYLLHVKNLSTVHDALRHLGRFFSHLQKCLRPERIIFSGL